MVLQNETIPNANYNHSIIPQTCCDSTIRINKDL